MSQTRIDLSELTEANISSMPFAGDVASILTVPVCDLNSATLFVAWSLPSLYRRIMLSFVPDKSAG